MVYAIGTGGIFQSQFHLLSHSVFKALLFLGAGAVIHAVGTRDMRQMGGLSRKMPLTCAVFVIGALALAGHSAGERVLEQGAAPGRRAPRTAVLGVRRHARHGGPHGAVHPAVRVDGVLCAAGGRMRACARGGPCHEGALIPLAVGSLLTWLLAGPFQDLLVRTLPLHFPGTR